MTSTGSAYGRAADRRASVSFRMSSEDKQVLHRRAVESGCGSIQIYLESVVFGRDPVQRASGPSPQRELPLTG